MFDGVDTRAVVEWFDLGGSLPLSDTTAAPRIVAQTRGVQGLRELAERTGLPRRRVRAGVASAIDFVLEGLCAQQKISRSDERGYTAGAESAPRRRRAARNRSSTRRSGSRAGRRSTTTKS